MVHIIRPGSDDLTNIRAPCPQCGGKKYDSTAHAKGKCKKCNGKGTVGKMENVNVPLPLKNIINEPVILIPQKGP